MYDIYIYIYIQVHIYILVYTYTQIHTYIYIYIIQSSRVSNQRQTNAMDTASASVWVLEGLRKMTQSSTPLLQRPWRPIDARGGLRVLSFNVLGESGGTQGIGTGGWNWNNESIFPYFFGGGRATELLKELPNQMIVRRCFTH